MIGIVGGVGPYAGLDLLKKIYDNTIANNDQEHLDTLLLSMSSSINDRTEYLIGRVDENPAYAIVKVLLKMETIGATVAGIPCNTAHSIGIFNVVEEELKKAGSSLKLLNMVNETISFIAEKHPTISKIGILSTTGTYKSGVYSKSLEAKGYNVILPTIEMQEELIQSSIYNEKYGIKSFSNPVTKEAIDNLHIGAKYLKENGAEIVILGCTEIPLALPEKEINGMITIDPTNILARALINNYAPNKLKGVEK
jgi:aspartate racemase